MNKPVYFSIIVPTYNRAHLVPATIESILAQTYDNYEILIIDDGSTDNTEEVMQRYISDRVHYFKKANGERAAARNYGTQWAKGDYVNWLDSDDLMTPDNLQVAADTINKLNRPEIIVQGYKCIDPSGEVISRSEFPPNLNDDLYRGNRAANSPVIVRRDIALANPFNEDRELSASEDYELWLRLASKYKFNTSPGWTVSYLYHDQRSTVVMSDPEQLIRRYEKFLQYTSNNPDVMTFLGKHKDFFVMKNYLLLAVDLANHDHLSLSRKYLAKSIKASRNVFFERGFYAYIKFYLKHLLS